MEGFYDGVVNESRIKNFFDRLCADLSLRQYGKPIIFSPEGMGKEENQGYGAFVPLIDSGISLYVWTSEKFFSVVVYTCKPFDSKQAVASTRDFFSSKEVEYQEF